MSLSKHALAVSAALALATPAALAHMGATGVVKERMDLMESMGRAAKGISRALRHNGPLDRAAIEAGAQRILKQSRRMLHTFPPGSHQHPSRAEPAIWSQWEDFRVGARDLETASAELVASAASDDRDSLSGRFDRIAQTCMSCHRSFRKARD